MDERIVLRGPIGLYVSEVLSANGTFVLTDARLVFRPGRVVERLDRSIGFTLRLGEITAIDVQGLERRLVITTAVGTQYRFHGSIAPALFLILRAMVIGRESAEDVADSKLCQVVLLKGVLPCRGALLATRRSVQFVPLGVVDAAMKRTPPLGFYLSEIARIGIEGPSWPRIALYRGAARYTFWTKDAPDLYARIRQRLLHAQRADEPEVDGSGTVASRVEADRILDRWRGSDLPIDDVVIMGPALQIGRTEGARRGWVCATRSHAMFLPATGLDVIQPDAVVGV